MTEFLTLAIAIAALITVILNTIAVRIMNQTVEAMEKGMSAQNFKAAWDILQDERVREARRHVFSTLKDKTYSNWSDTDKQHAEIMCHTYDAVAIMIRNGMLPSDLIVPHWAPTISGSWHIVKPMVEEYRSQRKDPQKWDDYEWLASIAAR